MQLLSLLSKSHDQSHRMGWWSDCPERTDPAFKWYIVTKLCLIHSEIDEATSLDADTHLPHRSAFEVELADAVIRALDLIGFLFGCDAVLMPPLKTDDPMVQCHNCLVAARSDDRFLMELHSHVSAAMEHYRKGREVLMRDQLGTMIASVDAAQQFFGINVYEAMIDKLAYNARRADHQLVNRQAAGGKSF